MTHLLAMAAWPHDGAGATWRLAASLLGLALIGTNVAFIRFPPLPREHSTPWRMFFSAKCMATSYIVLSLVTHTGDLSWRAPLATASITISLLSLGYMHWKRPYAPHDHPKEES